MRKATSFEPIKDLLEEELTVANFQEEKNDEYYVLYYDSVAIWQDPKVNVMFSKQYA